MNKSKIRQENFFVANQQHSVHFYHLLQVEYDLKKSFEECDYKDTSIIDDILVAVAVWIKDSEMNSKEKLSIQDIIAIIVKLLKKDDYNDIIQKFQYKSGFAILSKEQLYCRLNKVIKDEKIKIDTALKTRVYEQLKKLGYETNQISTNLIREITLQELEGNNCQQEIKFDKLENLSSWVTCSYYGHIFSSLRVDIDMSELFKNQKEEDFYLDIFIEKVLGDAFEELSDEFVIAKKSLDNLHYLSLSFENIPVSLDKCTIEYFLKNKLYPSIPKSVFLKTIFN